MTHGGLGGTLGDPGGPWGCQDRLGDLRSAISTSDPSAICDCLLYEFPAVSNDWAGLLYGLSRRYDSNATEEDEKES